MSESVGNLPIQLSDFIGRAREVADIQKLLSAHRLITLTGAGGSGKTRLSIKATSKLLDQFDQGIWFIEFAPLSDPELVPPTVASTLGIRDLKDQSILDRLVKHLNDHASLLIFDNCEHLMNACAQLAEELLKACPEIKILATSREPLSISGEVTWAVPPMSLPERQPWRTPKSGETALSAYREAESVQLFLNRAALAIPDFELTKDNGAWVAEICRRLDGMPLAIELAAARVRMLSVRQIAERLDDRFNLLSGGDRTAPPRHQTLAATIDWSYTLLSDEEQKFLQRLSVFSRGATLEAIEAVCTGDEIKKSDVLDMLSGLVDKSLVVANQKSNETRYHFLETVREFALNKLEESPKIKSVRDRHLEFFVRFTEEVELKSNGLDTTILIRKSEDERDNLLAALDWSMESQNIDAGLRVASEMSFFWSVRGYLRESIRWLERALEKKHDASPASTAKALRSLSVLLLTSKEKDFDRIDRLLNESLTLYKELEDKEGIAEVTNTLGWKEMEQGNYAKAREFLNESLILKREIGDPLRIAYTLQNFAPLSLIEGDTASAKAYTEETIALFQQAGNQHGVTRTTLDYAEIAHMEGDTRQALIILTRPFISRFHQLR